MVVLGGNMLVNGKKITINENEKDNESSLKRNFNFIDQQTKARTNKRAGC